MALASLVAAVLAGTVALAGLAHAESASRETPEQRQTITRDLDLAIVGVVIPDGGEPFAVVEDVRTRKQAMYRTGASLGGGRIVKILEDRLVLALPDGDVELRLAGAPGIGGAPDRSPRLATSVSEAPASVAAPRAWPEDPRGRFRQIDRDMLDTLIQGTEAATDVIPMPQQGVRVSQVRPGGLFQALDLRKGDVIRSVNGQPLRSRLPLSTALEQATSTGMLRLELERGGRHDVKYLQIRPSTPRPAPLAVPPQPPQRP